MEKHIKTVQKLDRNELIKGNKKDTPVSTHIPLAITYNRFLPNTGKNYSKKWNIISVNESLKQFFKNKPVTSLKCNKNFKELIGSNQFENNIEKKQKHFETRKMFPVFRNSRPLCCNNVKATSTFKSQQIQKSNKVFHQIICSSAYVI